MTKTLENALLELTPGGSEFHGSPERCIEWIKDRLSCTGKIAAERNRLRARLAAAESLAEALERVEHIANSHIEKPTHVANEYHDVIVVLRQVAHNAIRQYREADNG